MESVQNVESSVFTMMNMLQRKEEEEVIFTKCFNYLV